MTHDEVQTMRQVALLLSQTVAAQARLAGMQALNTYRLMRNETLAYSEADFEQVILDFGIGWNDAITTLNS